MPDKKKKEKIVGFKEFDPSKFVETEPTINEAAKGTAVISFGRMNPVTSGHEKLVNKVMQVAIKAKGTPLVFLSHTQDKKKNPLTYNDKIKFAQQAFGKVIQKSSARTIIEVAKLLSGKYSNLIVVAGSDRVKEFDTLLKKYNGKEYNFQVIDVQSAGERDPDADGVEGMSASKMRAVAADGDLNQFKKGLPKKLQRNADNVMSAVRDGMGLSEELDEALSRAARRKMAIAMRRNKSKIKIGREKAKRRRKDSGKMQSIARRKAIKSLQSKFAKNKRYADMDPSEKERIEKKIAKIPKERINRIARKMLIQVKKSERERFSKMATDNPATPKREDINLKVEQYLEEREHMDEKIGKMFKGAKDAAKIARGLNKARKFVSSPSGKAAAIGGAAVGAASAARTIHNVSKGVGKAGGYVAGKVANTFDKKKKVESFSKFVESKTIKVGESAIRADDVIYAHVKGREIQAIGDKPDMLAMAESDGGRVWMVSAESQVGDLLENKSKAQDPDIKDLPGTQPKEYFKGVEKDKKDDRDRHFKRNSKKSDDDPSAYKPAPGDKESKTKTSKHTKKFKQMYGEMNEMWGQRVSKRPHMLMDKNNKVKFDKRFKMYKLQQKELEESLDSDEVLDLMESMEHVESYMETLDESAKAGLKKKAKKSGMPYGILKKVYDRGMAAWKGGHRPGTTPQQWGMARVNSFTTKSSGTWGKADKDLAAKVRGSKKNEETEIDELSLSVKDIKKSGMSNINKAMGKDKIRNDLKALKAKLNKKEEVSDDYEKERRKAIKKAVNTKPDLDEKE